MSLHYILDGYNIIKQIPALKLKSLKSTRDILIQFIEKYKPQGSPSNKITVVFDGDKNVLPYAQQSSFNVFFSRGESADDKIRKLVGQDKNPKNVVVVTDDRELKFLVRSLGAQVMSVDDFLNKAKKDSAPAMDEKHLSYSAEDRITKELKKIWLR